MNEWYQRDLNPRLLKHIQCCFHCAPLVLINLHWTSLFLLGQKERIRRFYHLTEGGLPWGKCPFSLWTQEYQIHLHPTPPRLYMADGEIAETWKRWAPGPLPAPRAPQHAKSGAQRDKDSDLICCISAWTRRPLTPRGGSTSKAQVQPVKYSFYSLKGFQGGEGCNRVSSKMSLAGSSS